MFFKERKTSDGANRAVPLLPLRNLVLFPYQVVPLIVGRKKSISALQKSAETNKVMFLVAQHDANNKEPVPEAMFQVGTLCNILQMLRLPDGTVKVLVEGKQRAKVLHYQKTNPYFQVEVSEIVPQEQEPPETEALVRTVKSAFERYQKLHSGMTPETVLTVTSIDEASRLSDILASRLNLNLDDQQSLLEEPEPPARLERILKYLQSEIEILQVERKIKSRVKKQMERTQKEYYLNERMNAIQKELGEKDEFRSELQELEKRIKKKDMSEEATDRANRELRKLKMMSPMSAEATVVRNYLDWILALPWNELSTEQLELDLASRILDEDHYGLRKVKNRILEYLAVASLVEKMKGPILCLVGPPGVGKTSLGQSIARATGRRFVRQALGGVRDEAEIRGHRRTYIGALPGKILQCLKKAGTSNPVFLLDEVDKMSMDFRGDPSSALLEVLDPEQNHTFNDHYLDLDYDLSRVMFICTANTVEGVPPALLDRLEIIHLPGYTEREKLAITRRYLLPKQLEANGLKPENLTMTRQAVSTIIRNYTKEAGVRGLEREIAAICRKVARKVVRDSRDFHVRVTSTTVKKMLGVPRYLVGTAEERDEVGVVKGLAVTPWGGEMLSIEVAVVPGKGKLILTGLLGDWLKESATAAFSYIRSRAQQLGLEQDFHEKNDFHIHYPGNSIKTDGPSAGIAMATALVSALTGIPVRRDISMTGEISLRGRVLPIGGLKEKTLAAHRGEIATVLIPEQNKKDIQEIPPQIRDALQIKPVFHMDQVLQMALILDDAQALLHTHVPKKEDEHTDHEPPRTMSPSSQENTVPM